MLTFVALGIFVGQLIYPGIRVRSGDDRGQDPLRTVWIDLYRGQIIWRLRYFECTTALEEAAKTKLFKETGQNKMTMSNGIEYCFSRQLAINMSLIKLESDTDDATHSRAFPTCATDTACNSYKTYTSNFDKSESRRFTTSSTME